MNQAQIRYFVSTMNAVETYMPGGPGEPCLDVQSTVDSLNNLLECSSTLSSEDRAVIDKAISDLRADSSAACSLLRELENHLCYLIPTVSDDQAWRYEPYPWPGAPASPLLPLFPVA
jgi:hypothetical protein